MLLNLKGVVFKPTTFDEVTLSLLQKDGEGLVTTAVEPHDVEIVNEHVVATLS
jgi:DNA-directed RNA polymerase alpha subunit